MTSPSPSGGWLGRLAAVRGAGRAGDQEASAPAGSAAAPVAPQPSPNARAKAEATKRYIENLYSERNKAAAARLQRRKSLDTVAGKQVSHLPTVLWARRAAPQCFCSPLAPKRHHGDAHAALPPLPSLT